MVNNYITLTNRTSSQVSFEGDNGEPRVRVPATAGANTATVYIRELLGNEDLCDNIGAFITSSTLTVTRGSVTMTADDMDDIKQGADMFKEIYDADDDEVVDSVEAIRRISRTSVAFADTPYTVLAADTTIEVDTTGGAVALLLPTAVTVDGRTIEVIDVGDNAGTNAITITPDGAETIDRVAASVTISEDKGYMSLFCDGVSDWRTDHVEMQAAEDEIDALQLLVGTSAMAECEVAFDVKAVAETTANLSGTAGQDFVPQFVRCHIDTVGGAALNGDCTITIGTTTPGGVEVLAATQLTGLIVLNGTFTILLAGVFPAIAGNAALYVNVTIADTSGGTGTGTVTIQGRLE